MQPLEKLPWLPAAPADFRNRCAAVAAGDGEGLRFLACHALDLNQLNTLSRAAGKARPASGALAGLRSFHLQVVGSANTSFVPSALAASALRHGLELRVGGSGYGQMVQTAMDFAPDPTTDAVLLAFDHHAVPGLDAAFGDAASEPERFADMVVEGVRRGFAGALFLQTLPVPPEPLFGSLDAALPQSRRAAIHRFNAHLAGLAGQAGGYLLDVAACAEAVGTAAWFDPTAWVQAKLPFGLGFLPLYADMAARLCAAVAGRSRKCLVLDLDNTVWGGIIGDDGLGGIRLSEGDAVGEAFRSVQATALALKRRGIVLAVCSKNDHETALAPFRHHADMLLREDDIAVFAANWADKASNLESIARNLDLRPDALVLLDDNPAERAQVRQALPAVWVPELPEEPALYGRTLLWSGAFEAVTFTADDRNRAEAYAANARRQALVVGCRDLDEYLRSLEMVAEITPFRRQDVPRVAQLVNKSNQFNLTTRRYSEPALAALAERADMATVQVRLRDRFGDNGLISVVICRQDGDELVVDTWLMSCRVLKRRVEEAVLNHIAGLARGRGCRRVVGEFIPSGANELVRFHYRDLGFAPADAGAGGLWHLDVSSLTERAVPIAIAKADVE